VSSAILKGVGAEPSKRGPAASQGRGGVGTPASRPAFLGNLLLLQLANHSPPTKKLNCHCDPTRFVDTIASF